MAVAAELQPASAAPHREVVTALRPSDPSRAVPAAAGPKFNWQPEAALPVQPVELPTSSFAHPGSAPSDDYPQGDGTPSG
jgi:hypothetical protein